jgi:heat shock protein HtpX
MATLYTQQTNNIERTWFLMAAFFVLIIAFGFVFAQIFGNTGFLIGAILLSLIMNFGSYWFSDKIVLGMAGAKEIQKQDNPELWNIVENLAITAGLPMPKLYIVDDPSPNAFATGRDKEHAAVAVHTGILSVLDKAELEGVLAHELSHVGNRDILVSTIAVILAGFVSLLADFFFRFSLFGNRDNERGGGVTIIIGIALAILAPIFATLIKLAISRKREYLADASGAMLTRYPEGLARALEKISSAGIPSPTAHGATAHMYISNPFEGNTVGRKISGLFSTHPPIEERIRILRAMDLSHME